MPRQKSLSGLWNLARVGVIFIPLSSALASVLPWNGWEQAHIFYKNKQYPLALKELLEHPKSDATYHYNLGLTYHQLGELGRSLSHFEKANHLHPFDPDIKKNLSSVKSLLSQRIGDDRMDLASTWIEKLADRISLDEARATLGLFAVLLTLIWIRSYLKTRQLRMTLTQPSAYLGAAALLLTCGIYAIERWANSHPPAIVLKPDIIRSGPSESYQELSRTEEGMRLRLRGTFAQDDRGEVWHQIQYSPDAIGWLKSSSLFVLD